MFERGGRARGAIGFVMGVVMATMAVALPAWALSCNDCVTSGDIVNGQVKAADIASGAVGSPEIASNAVKSSEIAAGAVRAGEMGTMPAVRAYNDGNQSAPTGTDTAITFNTEQFDNGGMHSLTTNTSRFYAPRDGIYDLGYSVGFDNSDTDGSRQFTIRGNGGVFYPFLDRVLPIVGQSFMSAQGSVLFELSAGDYVELYLTQLSGSTITIYGDSASLGGYQPAFWMRWVGPTP